MSENILEVENLIKHYPIKGGIFFREIGKVHAVNGVSFSVKAGETLGIVGESGCGKSTLGRTIIKLEEATGGSVIFDGIDLMEVSSKKMRNFRRDIQMIFQDPYESLNSRHTVGMIIEEPFIIHNIGDDKYRKKEVLRLLNRVGLPESAVHKYPHEFSGGQRQRIGIARAIALRPKLIICDEPVSALDVSVQSQVLNLLLELQEEMNLTYLFIAHDLSVVKHISDKVMVMYLGKVMEVASSDELYKNPLHPYTKALISAIPVPDPEKKTERVILHGDIPSSQTLPKGCVFASRCPVAEKRCLESSPDLKESKTSSHFCACHLR